MQTGQYIKAGEDTQTPWKATVIPHPAQWLTPERIGGCMNSLAAQDHFSDRKILKSLALKEG